jgi:hypothetical protein
MILLRGGGGSPLRGHSGIAVKVDPIKPTLKAPGTERLKLKHEELLSNFGFKFNLRRYTLYASFQTDSHIYFVMEYCEVRPCTNFFSSST